MQFPICKTSNKQNNLKYIQKVYLKYKQSCENYNNKDFLLLNKDSILKRLQFPRV